VSGRPARRGASPSGALRRAAAVPAAISPNALLRRAVPRGLLGVRC